MRWISKKKKKRSRSRRRAAGMEIVGALSIASQMALLCPPGFDEWVRRELSENGAGDRRIGVGANGGRQR
jgi:hypothetical protein